MVKRIILALLFVAAIAALGFLYKKTNDLGANQYAETMSIVRDLQKVDASWSAETLKSRAALNKDFDAIAAILPQLRDVKTRLASSELAQADKSSPEVETALARLIVLMGKKEAAVERFKSGHAIMRNSIRYLPQGAREATAAAKKAKARKLAASINSFLNNLYVYVLLPSKDLKQMLMSDIGKLNKLGSKYPTSVTESLARFLNHSQLILDRHEQTQKLLDTAVSTPTVKATYDMVNRYNAFHRARIVEIESYRYGLFGFTALLLMIVAYVGIRLIRSYADLNVANSALHDANDNLEGKVEQRTMALKESQAYLVQSEKMAAVGQMVAGVAHEINTPLGYVSGNVESVEGLIAELDGVVVNFSELTEEMVKSEADAQKIDTLFSAVNEKVAKLKKNETIESAVELLGDAHYGLDQISDIVVNLKDFSRMDRAKDSSFNVNDGLQSTLKIANNMIKNAVRVDKEFAEVPEILCSPSQLNQVFLNIITNAVHATGASERESVVKLKTYAENDSVFIAISDNGIGMPKNIMDHIFEPFYTTKDVGKGTGLGLSISHKIIEDHGGSIKVNSSEGKGTIFLIELPIEQKDKDSEGSETNESESSQLLRYGNA